LTQPTPANDFLVTNDTPLDPTTLTAVFQALWFRIRDLQEIAAGFENAVSQSAIELANGKLNLSVSPALNALNARVGEITALMADAEDRLAALQNGGVAAENVPIGAIEGFPANTNAADAFRMLGAFAAAAGETLQSIGETAGAAQPKADKNQPNGYAGLGASGKVLSTLMATSMSPAETFTASGTFTKQPDDIAYLVEAVGGGGAGAWGSYGGGGCGGVCVNALVTASEVAATETVTVGAGGTIAASGARGNMGGRSSFGALLVAPGGSGGAQGSSSYTDTLGSYSVGPSYDGVTQAPNTPGVQPGSVFGAGTTGNAAGGSTIEGGGGGAGCDYRYISPAKAGGLSVRHGRGGDSTAAGAGIAGAAPGGGGGGGFQNQPGPGGRGHVRIWRIKK
jgi:hypothetical protein